MTGLRIYTGNRLEILAQALADVLVAPLSSPLANEVIVVQSKGMEHWLSMTLARLHGVCANVRFPFPNRFVDEIFRLLLPDLMDKPLYDPRVSTWRIMDQLPGISRQKGFEQIASYIGTDNVGRRPFQLAGRIADLFDQYIIFRPGMIDDWEKNREDHWQANLWGLLFRDGDTIHRASLARRFFESVEDCPTVPEGMPERISIFGISALPRFHTEILAVLSRLVPVNIFLMNPCREYWGDILSPLEMRRATGKSEPGVAESEALYLQRGNRLLSNMGTLGRDFFDLLHEFPFEEIPLFLEPEENTLLHRVQSDILKLRDRGPQREKTVITDLNDRSIQFHACHSPMREIEILQDQILQMLEQDPDLEAREILVMAPDIETYAPYIRAVFDLPAGDPRRLPFTIADRSIRGESDIVDTFLALIDLCGGRYTASRVLDILQAPAVSKRFRLSDPDMDKIRKWVKETQTRWGIDRHHRKSLGLPAFPENTWQAGLDRLLLGYAMVGDGLDTFHGILPYDPMEGDESLTMGRFADFTGKLFTAVPLLETPRTLGEWTTTLTDLLDLFFEADDENEREIQALRQKIAELDRIMDTAPCRRPVPLEVVQWDLRHALEREGFGLGFMTGGITFCAMLPMRSIPFKIICLIGMNGDAYPRQSIRPDFDLMAAHPRPGDRSVRNDDRYLFLECLLSARNLFYISYTGQSMQDNSPIPPSVLVSELKDYLDQGFQGPESPILDRLVTRHRLQAFSPAYFREDEHRFSYSEANLEAARCLVAPPRSPTPFISAGLQTPDEEWKTVSIGDLCRFLGNPAKFLLNRRLGLFLGESEPALQDEEPFAVGPLDRFLLEGQLLENRLAGRDINRLFPAFRASGRLPHGTVGQCTFEDMSRNVETFAEKIKPYLKGDARSANLDLSIDDFRLVGRIENIYHGGLVQYRFGRIRGKDLLEVWALHLCLNASGTDRTNGRGTVMGLESSRGFQREWIACTFAPVKEGLSHLRTLLRHYWEGLHRPLRFFPETSHGYTLERLEKGRSVEQARTRVRSKWSGTEHNRGEREDPYFSLCFKETDPLDETFCTNSEEIFGPLLEHMEKIQ